MNGIALGLGKVARPGGSPHLGLRALECLGVFHTTSLGTKGTAIVPCNPAHLAILDIDNGRQVGKEPIVGDIVV